jgi:hypothetical protein
VAGGGLANFELLYNNGLIDVRGDANPTITTVNGPLSNWTSGQGISGTVSQSTESFRPSHVDASDVVSITGSTASNDTTNGKWLSISNLASRYTSTPNALGVSYMLVRFPTLPTWNTVLFQVGVNSSTYTNRDRLRYIVILTATQWFVARGTNTSAQQATLGTRPAANEWVALAHVINDDRTTPGTSDNISRLFLKTKPGGTYATMQQLNTSALSLTGTWTGAEATINRVRWNNSASTEGLGNFDLHSYGFDAIPPTTNAGIEANLDRLLSRVP